MNAHIPSGLALALAGSIAAPAHAQVPAPLIEGEVSVAKTAVSQFDPVFLAFGVHSTIATPQDAAIPLSLVEVQMQVGNDWIDQPTHAPDGPPLTFLLEANVSFWIEMPTWDSRVFEAPGTYRVRFTFYHGDAGAPNTAPVQSPWQTVTVAAHAANVTAMQAAGVRAQFDTMLAFGFGETGRPASAVADIDESLVTPLQAANLSTDLRTFASVVLAHRRLADAEAEFLGTAQTNALNAAAGHLAGLSSQSFTGKVGGLGAHLIHAQALVDWYRATTTQQFDQATALFQTISTRFPAAGSAYDRESLEWIRELRF